MSVNWEDRIYDGVPLYANEWNKLKTALEGVVKALEILEQHPPLRPEDYVIYETFDTFPRPYYWNRKCYYRGSISCWGGGIILHPNSEIDLQRNVVANLPNNLGIDIRNVWPESANFIVLLGLFYTADYGYYIEAMPELFRGVWHLRINARYRNPSGGVMRSILYRYYADSYTLRLCVTEERLDVYIDHIHLIGSAHYLGNLTTTYAQAYAINMANSPQSVHIRFYKVSKVK